MGIERTSASPEELLAEVEWVRRVARALVGRGESDEVVQQAYLQALSTPPAPGPLRRWLRTVVRNVVRRNVRNEATRERHEVRAPVAARTPEPGETVARAELHRRVVESVLALDEPYRSTLLLRFFEDQSAEAIARAQSLSIETVRTRVKRGIAQLRARLEKEVGGEGDAGAVAWSLWFEQLSRFAGDGAKGAVASGAAAVTGVIVMTARATWILASVATTAVVVTAWWLHVQSSASSSGVASGRAGSVDPLASPAIAVATPASTEAAPPPAATRTAEAATPASAPAAMKPFVGGNRGVVRGRVRDGKGDPVAGAEVKALRANGGGWFASLESYAGESWLQTTTVHPRPLPAGVVVTRSDAAGRFEFGALSTIPDWCIGAFDPVRGAAVSDAFHFDQEQATHEVELSLTSGAVVRGHVRDEGGRPIVDAMVQFGVGRGTQSSWTSFHSGSDGAWSAGYVCGEKVSVEFVAPGFVAAPLPWTTLESVERELVVDVVMRPNGDQLVRGPIVDATGAAVDLRRPLDALLGSDDDEVRGGGRPPIYSRVTMGAVSPEDQQPVPGSRVSVFRVIGCANLASGRYEVTLPANFHGTLFLAAHGTCVGTAAIENVAQPPALPLDLKFVPPRQVTSHVVVHVVDAKTNEPVDLHLGYVTATAPLPTHTPYGPIATPDAPPGVAEFVISPARISIRAEFAGYTSTATEIVVNPDERRREITIPLHRATAGLRGRALRVDGSAIQQSSVALYRVTPNGVVAVTGPGSGTNAYGEFEFLGLAAAEHVVVVTAPDEACAVARVCAADPPTEFELHAVPGTRTEFHLKPAPPRPWTGQMFRIVDEEGIPLLNTFGGWSSSSGGDSTLEATLRPGSYRILIWREGCRETTHEFDVPSDAPIEIELESTR